MVSKSPPNALKHHDWHNMTTDWNLEAYSVHECFILASRQCFCHSWHFFFTDTLYTIWLAV